MRMVAIAALASLCLLVTGCSLESTAKPSVVSAVGLHGSIHGGQQPVVGAHVYLFAAGTGGYDAPTNRQPSASLLKAANTGLSDSLGAYVLTDTNGSFDITNDYTCIANSQVYVYGAGGNPGAGTNSAATFMALLGNCPSSQNFATAYPFISVNEVTTIAAAYAMAGFATDPLHVSSSGSALALTGIANAFANAGNLVDLPSGVALLTTPAGTGTAPQATVNTLANVLAYCINSTDSGSSVSANCADVFALTKSGGTTGTAPADTATAAINIAHNPSANIAALYTTPVPTPPFSPVLKAQPNDFSLGVLFYHSSLHYPGQLALDAAGNVWFTNNNKPGTVVELSPLGAVLTPAAGLSGGGLTYPEGVALDKLGNVWFVNGVGSNTVTKYSPTSGFLSGTSGYSGATGAMWIAFDGQNNAWLNNYNNYTATEFNNTGTVLSPTNGYPAASFNEPYHLAIDGAGGAWYPNLGANSVTKLSNAGANLSGTSGFTGGNLATPQSLALDSAGAAWIANPKSGNNSITKLSNAGAVLSGTTGFTGGGLNEPIAVSIDGLGNAWIASINSSLVAELSSTGTVLSGSTGYTGGGQTYEPQALAVDGSGDLWVVPFNVNTGVVELIGIASPVITPIAAGLPTTFTTDGTSKLGTRP